MKLRYARGRDWLSVMADRSLLLFCFLSCNILTLINVYGITLYR